MSITIIKLFYGKENSRIFGAVHTQDKKRRSIFGYSRELSVTEGQTTMKTHFLNRLYIFWRKTVQADLTQTQKTAGKELVGEDLHTLQ
jgi:hypothetical protein